MPQTSVESEIPSLGSVFLKTRAGLFSEIVMFFLMEIHVAEVSICLLVRKSNLENSRSRTCWVV